MPIDHDIQMSNGTLHKDTINEVQLDIIEAFKKHNLNYGEARVILENLKIELEEHAKF